MSAPAYGAPNWSRLRMHRNPIRMAVSAGTWASAWYVFASMFIGLGLFIVITTAVPLSIGLVAVWAGLPMMIGTAYFIRGCVAFERARARVLIPEGLPPLEPDAPSEGFFGLLKTQWTSKTTKRGLVHFVLLGLPLVILDTIVICVWLSLLAMLTAPIWYRYIPQTFDNGTKAHGLDWGYFPNGPHGSGGWGLWIGSTGAALVAAALCLVLLLAWNYVLVATARMHVNAVHGMITYRDPLAQAKQVLGTPGPLRSAAGQQ